jgi:hypothetical protein
LIERGAALSDGGANYHVDSARPNTVGGIVILNKATARRGSQTGGGFFFTTSWVEGKSSLRICSSKNTWASGYRQTEGPAFTIPMGRSAVTSLLRLAFLQVEMWKFKTPELNLDQSSADFSFAIFYNNPDTGEWFWDNNFGEDCAQQGGSHYH